MSPLRASLLVFSLVTPAACGDDTTGPTPASVAATYHASRVDFTPPGSSQPVNGLGLGVSVTIELTAEGTTRGTLTLPPELTEDGMEQVIDLTGTYTISGTTLTFNGQRDSFISEVPWTIRNGTLTAVSHNLQGILEVTLARSQVS